MSYNPYDTEESFFVATKVCFIYQDTVLVLSEARPGKPLWRELPGGKISKTDRDIPPIASLEREVTEELGWKITMNDENTHLFMCYKSYENVIFSSDPVPFIFLCYVHNLVSIPEIILSHEHVSVAWISENEIDTFSDWRPGFDTIIQKAFLHHLSHSIHY